MKFNRNDIGVSDDVYMALSHMESMQNLGSPGVCVKELDESLDSKVFFQGMQKVFAKFGGLIVYVGNQQKIADLYEPMPHAGKWLFYMEN
jgi:hypothetical protein